MTKTLHIWLLVLALLFVTVMSVGGTAGLPRLLEQPPVLAVL